MKMINNSRADTISYNMYLALLNFANNRSHAMCDISGDTAVIHLVGSEFEKDTQAVIDFVGNPSYLLVGENFSIIKYKVREDRHD